MKVVYTSRNGRVRVWEGPMNADEERKFYARQTPKRMHRNLQQTPQEAPQTCNKVDSVTVNTM